MAVTKAAIVIVCAINFVSGKNIINARDLTATSSASSSASSTSLSSKKSFFKTTEWRQIGESMNGGVTNQTINIQCVSLSYDGNRVVMGSPFDYNYDYSPGSATVKVFDLDDADWEEVGRFLGRTEDGFGWSAVLSGNGKRLAIGSMYNDNNSGIAEMYEETPGNQWVSLGTKLVGQSDDMFGRVLALSEDGSQVAIGAPDSDQIGKNSGYVQIFQLAEDEWKQKGQTIAGENQQLHFGRSVSMSADGNIVAIGIAWSDENGSNSGSVKVFRYSIDRKTVHEKQQIIRKWVQVGQTLLGGTKGDHFGASVSINANGDILSVGAYSPPSFSEDGAGYVKVFHLKDDTWEAMGQTLYGKEGERFGYSVSLAPYSNRVAIGSSVSSDTEVEIFDYGQNTWVQIGNLVPLEYDTYFGSVVSLSSSGDRVAVGFVYDDGTNKYGSVKVFELS